MTSAASAASAPAERDDEYDEYYDCDYDFSSPFDLSGKTALVTGSSGGIGRAISLALARAGADVVVHYNSRREGALSTLREINRRYRDVVEGENKQPGRCLGMVCADFRDPHAVDEMFRAVVRGISNRHDDDDNGVNEGDGPGDGVNEGDGPGRGRRPRRIDILVNNAGIVTKLAMEDDDDVLLSSYHETMAVNLHAPLRLMRLAHRHMKSTAPSSLMDDDGRSNRTRRRRRRQGGVIINNTSVHASRSVEYMTAYAASKAALESLTRGLACEYAPDDIRVNAIAPGVVPVERTAELFSDEGVVDMWTPRIPLGRLGTVEDVAHATLLLVTNEWMTGTVLTVDGGMMARANMPIRPRPPAPPEKAGGGLAGFDGDGGGGDTGDGDGGSSLEERMPPPRVLFEVPSGI